MAAALVALLCTPSMLMPSSTSLATGMHGHSPRVVTLMQLQMPEDGQTVEALCEQTTNTNAIVVLHFSAGVVEADTPNPYVDNDWGSDSWAPSSFSLSGTAVARVASEYGASKLYGGAPLVVLQIDNDLPGMDVVCAQRGIVNFPTIQIWRGGVCEEVSGADLEARLLSYGVASRAKRFEGISGTATFESDVGSGLPSATAVDEIDFTGGAGGRALGTQKDGRRGLPRDRGTTRDYFPSPKDAPGNPWDNKPNK
jgi:hypothetical protein